MGTVAPLNRRVISVALIVAMSYALLGVALPASAQPVGSITYSGPVNPATNGTAVVGGTIGVAIDPGDWSPTPDYDYQWYSVADGLLAGETQPTYSPVLGDLGDSFYATVTSDLDGYSPYQVTSSWSPTIALAQFVHSGATNPAITGSQYFDGGGLTTAASLSDWSPLPDHLDYQWYDVSTGIIPGMTSSTFNPAITDIGRSLYVTVTAVLSGYQDYSVTSVWSGAVAQAQFALSAAPSIPSAAFVGQSLTVTPATFAVSPTAVTYTWHRADSTQVGTGTSYVPAITDIGEQLYAVATVQRDGYQDYVVGSNLTGAVALNPFVTPSIPTIVGSGIVGEPLVVDANASQWSPTPDSFEYRWFVASAGNVLGTVIPGAITSSYTPTADQAGSYLYVEVTAIKANYAPYIIGSGTGPAIAFAPEASVSTSTVAVGGAFTLSATGLKPSTTYELELHSTPVSLGSVTTNSSGAFSIALTVPSGTAPGAHSVVILRGGVPVLTVSITAVEPTLAFTGSTPIAEMNLALLLLILGVAAAVYVGRRGSVVRAVLVREPGVERR